MSAAHRCVVILQLNVMPQLCFLTTELGRDWSALCAHHIASEAVQLASLTVEVSSPHGYIQAPGDMP